MQMEKGLDTGPVLLSLATPVSPEDTGGSLHDRLAALGAEVLADGLKLVRAGMRPVPQPQSADGVTYAHKLDKAEARLDWSLPAEVLANRVRAFDPWPVAEAELAGERVRIHAARAVSAETGRTPGTVLAATRDGLDVACGSGALSIPAARGGAQVTAVDQSPAMLELLRARAHAEKLDIETRVMDGHALALAGNQFDLVGSQFGVMLFPDMPQGIREMARVVKPGGRVLVHAYGDPHRIDFLGFLVGALQSVRPGFAGPPMDPPPLPFQLADPARLRAELAAAGLKSVRVETVTETTAFQDGEALWDWIVCSNPIVDTVLGSLSLTADEIDTARGALDRLLRERGAGGVARLSNPVHIGTGTK